MRHPLRWAALGVALVVVVFGVVLAVNVGSDPQAANQHSPFLGKPVPRFNLPVLTTPGVDVAKLTDGRVSKASTAGKAVIINFWNTWCAPCREELPELKDFYAQHASDSDFQMIGILRDPQESSGTVQSYMKAEGVDWTVARDPGDRAALDFATRGQPETLAISPSGVVAASQYGPMTVAELEKFLAAARAYG